MALTREEISEIAQEVASQFTGMRCACKNLHPIFLSAIEGDLRRWGAPGSPESQELQASLAALAKDCGYERDNKGYWVQFPGQEKALQDLGTDYEVIEEHDDGDLTIRIPAHNTKAVVTTEGEVFTKPNNPGTRYQEEGEEPIVSETEAFEKRLGYELKREGFTAEPGGGNPTTVQCPICKQVIDIPQYDKVSRSDALTKHIKEEHTGWMAELKGGNPKTKYLPCPICLDGKQKPRFIEEGLRYHLREFHKRVDVDELVRLAKDMAGEGNPVEYVTITDPGKTTLASRR